MRARETVARAMAKVEYRARHGFDSAGRETAWTNRHWLEHESAAGDLLRRLKGQPPHVTDAGLGCPWAEALDNILEAMARS